MVAGVWLGAPIWFGAGWLAGRDPAPRWRGVHRRRPWQRPASPAVTELHAPLDDLLAAEIPARPAAPLDFTLVTMPLPQPVPQDPPWVDDATAVFPRMSEVTR